MNAKLIFAAVGLAISVSLSAPAMSSPLEGSIIEDAAEDEMMNPVCDRLEDKCEEGKGWACRALQRECED